MCRLEEGRNLYRLVHAFRRSRGTKSRVREKHIPTDLVHGFTEKLTLFISPLSSDNYLIMITLSKENIS